MKNKLVPSINTGQSVIQTNYAIVKAHEGAMKVKTKENEGTEFLILLSIVDK